VNLTKEYIYFIGSENASDPDQEYIYFMAASQVDLADDPGQEYKTLIKNICPDQEYISFMGSETLYRVGNVSSTTDQHYIYFMGSETLLGVGNASFKNIYTLYNRKRFLLLETLPSENASFYLIHSFPRKKSFYCRNNGYKNEIINLLNKITISNVI